MNVNNKTILITGGTGSFGKAYATYLLTTHKPKKVILFSRDEQKHYSLAKKFEKWDTVQFVIGDIRDRDKLIDVCRGVDLIIHSAAMKHMPMAELHPMEAIKTNILGTQNLIDACIANDVDKVVALSTDKAALPINVYGGSKLLLERLFIAANEDPKYATTFSVVRFTNIFGSKGSVVPLFLKLRKTGELPITHPEMTRFSITLNEGIRLMQFAIEKSLGGEIIVHDSPSYKVADLAVAICSSCEKRVTGRRTAEKMHEISISKHEATRTLKSGKYYIILPENTEKEPSYLSHYNCQFFDLAECNSGLNSTFLSKEDIKNQIDQMDHE